MGRKKQDTTAAEYATPSGESLSGNGKVAKKRESFYLVVGLTADGTVDSCLHQAKSWMQAQRWIDGSAMLLQQLGKTVVILRVRPVPSYHLRKGA